MNERTFRNCVGIENYNNNKKNAYLTTALIIILRQWQRCTQNYNKLWTNGVDAPCHYIRVAMNFDVSKIQSA